MSTIETEVTETQARTHTKRQALNHNRTFMQIKRLLMRATLAFILIAFCQLAATAQSRVDSSVVIEEKPQPPYDVLGALDQAARGALDPFIAIPKVIEQRDSALGALGTLLATGGGSVDERISPSSDPVRRRKQIYALWCLEGMGTEKAYQMLFAAATGVADNELRGVALKALATMYYMNDYAERTVPNKELVHLFMSNVDDTAEVAQLHLSLGEVAREGMINWTGKDPGEPQGTAKSTRMGPYGKPVLLKDLREQWWRNNSAKVSWDAGVLRFKLP